MTLKVSNDQQEKNFLEHGEISKMAVCDVDGNFQMADFLRRPRVLHLMISDLVNIG